MNTHSPIHLLGTVSIAVDNQVNWMCRSQVRTHIYHPLWTMSNRDITGPIIWRIKENLAKYG